MKKIFFALIILFILPSSPIAASHGKIGEYIPPVDSDFYKKRVTWKFGLSDNIIELKFLFYENQEALDNYTPKEINLINESWLEGKEYIWVDIQCNGIVIAQYKDNRNSTVNYQYTVSKSMIPDEYATCGGKSARPSNYDESLNEYPEDTFGKEPEQPDPGGSSDPDPGQQGPGEHEPGTGESDDYWDWDFFWGLFGFLTTIAAPFLMLIIAISAVGLLLYHVIAAVKQN